MSNAAPDLDEIGRHATNTLTGRQREIAALVARGYTNRQIADELVLTPGTVANHVRQILGRLQAESRAQIAAWATTHGLSTTQDRLLTVLEHLLEIDTTSLPGALSAAAVLVRDALGADRTYIFLHEAGTEELVLIATSDTESNGLPHTVSRWLTAEDLAALQAALGARSAIFVPLEDGERRVGLLGAVSSRRDMFLERDERFLTAVSRWVSVVARQAALTQSATIAAVHAARASVTQDLVMTLAEELARRTQPLARDIDLLHARAQHIGRLRDLGATQRLAHELRDLRSLVEDLLDVAGLERRHFELHPKSVDLAELARSIAMPFRRNGVDVRVTASGEVVIVADTGRVRQALEHLVAEVHHRRPNSRIVVDVRTEQRTGQSWATARVASPELRGAGPHPSLDRRNGAEDHEPSSVGLRLAARIAEVHAGTLTVHDGSADHVQLVLSLPVAPPALSA